MKIILVALILCVFTGSFVMAHNNHLGGHYNEGCGIYHFHNVGGDFIEPLHYKKHPREEWFWVPDEHRPDDMFGPWVYTVVSTRGEFYSDARDNYWDTFDIDALAFYTDGEITEARVAADGAELTANPITGDGWLLEWDIGFLPSGRGIYHNIHHLARDLVIGDDATSFFYGVFIFDANRPGIADMFMTGASKIWLNGEVVYRAGGCAGYSPDPTLAPNEPESAPDYFYGGGVQVYIKDERNLMLVKVGRQEGEKPYWHFQFGLTPHDNATEISVPVVYKRGRVQAKHLVTSWSQLKGAN